MDAMISGRGGLALVVDGDRVASIHASEPERMIPRHRSEVHYLLGEARDFVAVESASREEIVRQLISARDREHALQLALILLDPDLSGDIRQDGAGELEELFEQEDLVVYVESVLYAKPLPEDSDLPGGLTLAGNAPAEKVAAMLGKLEASQSVIAEVRQAWEAIPPESFSGEEQHWQAAAVREGFFRQLVLDRTAGKNANAFFVDASMRPAIRALPSSRAVLRAWIGPFIEHYQVNKDWARQSEQPQVVRERRSRYKGRKRKRKSLDRGAALEKVNRQKEEIKRAMGRRDWARVEKYVDELVGYHMTHGGAEYAAKSLCDLAMKAKELGQNKLQLEWTERSVRLQEQDGWAWAQYGDALLQLNRFDEAIQAFDQAAQFGESLIAQKGRAEVLKAQGRLEEALDAYQDVTIQHPEDVVAKNGRAEVLKALGRLEEALDAYQDVTIQHPEDVVAKTGHAEVLKALGRLDEALVAYDDVRHQHPENVVARNGYAWVLALTDRWDEALAILPTGEPNSLQDWIARHIRGMIYLRLRRYQQAIDSLQTGIDSCLWYPQKSYFKTALALARLQQENAEGAAELASEIDDLELQIPTNVIRVHAFGKVDKAEEAATAFRALPDVLPFAGRELKRELHRRFIARTGGQHDDDWLYEQEWRLLAAA